MPTQQKIDIVSDLSDKFARAKGIYFTDYLGLKVSEITELRKTFFESGVEFHITKNTLIKLASKDLKIDDSEMLFTGPTAIALSYDDPTAPARIIKDFTKEHDFPKLKAFMFEGEYLDKSEFVKIAALPSREVLLTKLVYALSSPLGKMATMIKSPMVNLVNILNSLKETKQS